MTTQTETETETETGTCEEHGEYEIKVFALGGLSNHRAAIGGAKCPTCESIYQAKLSKAHELQREEKRKLKIKECIEQFERQIPKRFNSASLKSYVIQNEGQRKAMNICHKYLTGFDTAIKNTGGGLIFSGTVGTGKTHLAIAIGRELSKRGVDVDYANLTDLIRRVRATWSGEGNERDVIGQLQKCGLLIIDEVGVQAGSENERNMLFEIIDGRYQNILPTIIISNLERAKISELISERSVDRITQGGAVIPFNWNSERSVK
ncbi:ATP-binding protein [Glaciecola siphonariae]|uniref:ATP-binding protein n=1 Tax=Glaciecola siphonariae TaxID=521012 RepID=A0ABV9LU37_9ALTE